MGDHHAGEPEFVMQAAVILPERFSERAFFDSNAPEEGADDRNRQE